MIDDPSTEADDRPTRRPSPTEADDDRSRTRRPPTEADDRRTRRPSIDRSRPTTKAPNSVWSIARQ